MGTVFNAKKWKGACVKGKKVCGLVKNGVLFFKSDNYIPPISEIYKRRIMVGDNLKGKKVYADFPNNYYTNLDSRNVDIIPTTYISAGNGSFVEYIDDSQTGGNYTEYFSGASAFMVPQVRYRRSPVDESETIVEEGLVNNDKDYIVSSIISDNDSYKHIFVEDTNIRPFQVGDVISENTKIYFVIPDNIGLSAINTMNPGKYTSNPVSFENNNVQIYGQISGSTYKVIFKASKDYTIYSSNFTNVSSNLSKFVPDSGTSFSATVSSINTDSYLYEYILVDKTTLG